MMTDIILSLSNIYKSFTQGKTTLNILNGANLEIKKGEIVALIGPSGSGKSTLLYTAGLLDKIDSGEIVIDGKNCNKLSDNAKTKIRLQKMGFVYQQHNLFADFTALENVMLPMLVNGKSKKQAKIEATQKLEKVGLGERINHKPSELSGGEQQRVAIARALANNPALLLADEPTGNLDPYNSESVFENLLNLVKNDGMTAFIATHNPELAKKMDRQIALVEGKLYDIKNADDKAFLKTNPIGKKILDAFK
ncbi:MAG: ABC transporter ATP-binding protein [Alphaproteobacteria bacterium]|nr:ABC transporter ATP-binding protein [Alphaproteobacteria bacterium]MBR4316076.1 ABC transporter ATP-binding protein [Alphaproteobacteria bacterium]